MKKTLLTLSIKLVFNNCISQSFKKYELKRLNAFEIKNETTDIYNSENYLYLKDILEKEQKQITRKTGGIIFTSLSILITALGARIYSTQEMPKMELDNQSERYLWRLESLNWEFQFLYSYRLTKDKKKEIN